MRDLNYQLKQLCVRNHDGSFGTRNRREITLTLMANQLHQLGYRQMRATSLKSKHVEALVARWQAEGIATGTFKNRMSYLRWWAEKIGKQNVIARRNDAYGIPDRVQVSNVSKAKVIDADTLARVKDRYTAMSLRLEAAFGLRREESIKIIPVWADLGDLLRLKGSWTKGGRYREVPIRTMAQRELLAEAKQLAGRGSLIPAELRYCDQLRRFVAECQRIGIGGVHGLRHQYAQTRYEELTGWPCRAAGGPTSKQLTPAQKAADREARLAISRELGHERESVTSVYLGR